MNEKKKISQKSKSLFLRMKVFCEKRRWICILLFNGLVGVLIAHTLYFTYRRMSWEMWKIFVTLFFLGAVLVTIFVHRWERRIDREGRGS